jgi:hypothetical protein
MQFYIFFLEVLGFELKASCLLPGTLLLEPCISSSMLWLFWGQGLAFCHASLDHDPPILCFLPSLGCQVYITMPSFFLLTWGLPNFSAWLALNCDPLDRILSCLIELQP